jgi:hypothetical protein
MWENKTSGDFQKKKWRAGRTAGSLDIPWHNWLVLGSESPNIFCYVLFGIIRLRETFEKNWALGEQQQVLNLDIPWHNWLVLGLESPNIFCFVLFEIIRLQETFEKKMRAGRPAGGPQYGKGTSGSFWVQSLQFFFCFFLIGIKKIQETSYNPM